MTVASPPTSRSPQLGQAVGLRSWASGSWYYGIQGGYSNAVIYADGDQTWAPVWVPAPIAVDRIGARVSVIGGVGCVVRLGYYLSGSDGYPGVVSLDAGTIDGNALGAQEITIAATLPAGLVWFSAKVEAGTPQLSSISAYRGWTPVKTLAIAVGNSSTTNEVGGLLLAAAPAGAFQAAPAMSALAQKQMPQIVVRTA